MNFNDVTLACGDGQSVRAQCVYGSNWTRGATTTQHSVGNLTNIILACRDEQSVEGHNVSLVPTGQTNQQPPVAMRGELNTHAGVDEQEIVAHRLFRRNLSLQLQIHHLLYSDGQSVKAHHVAVNIRGS